MTQINIHTIQNTTQFNDILYQENPQWRSRNPNRIQTSFTESIESYMRAARQESWILENNNRIPKQEIVLRYFVVLSINKIRENWKRLHRQLKQAGIMYAASIELTDGQFGRSTNSIHYHFLIDTNLDRTILMDLMKTICMNSKLGIYGQEYDLIYPNAGITDWGIHKIHYFTKYGYGSKIHLFKVGLRIKKFYYSSGWFIERDGTVTTKGKILKRLKDGYKLVKKNNLSPVPCPFLALFDGSNDESNIQDSVKVNRELITESTTECVVWAG